MVTLEAVQKEDEYILHNLMQFYIYEFSQYIPSIKLESNGLFAPFHLDEYWTNSHFHAFFIKLDNEYIGFALVESGYETEPNSILEFFIMSKFKGRGYGKVAATELFTMFPGSWKITQISNNYPAQAFWRNLIYKITDGQVVERYDNRRRSVQEFHTDSLK